MASLSITLKDKRLSFSLPNLKLGVVASMSEELTAEPNEKTILELDLSEPKLNDGMLASLASSILLVVAEGDAMVGVGGGSEKAAGVPVTGKVKLKPLSQILSFSLGLVAGMEASEEEKRLFGI